MIPRMIRAYQQTALRHVSYRRLWLTTILSSTARWADLVVVGWLTLELTDSPLMVGVVSACKMAGLLLAPLMGVAADRMDRRKLLIAASLVSWAVSALMLFLLLTHGLTVSHLIVLSLVGSLPWALDNPTRQAYVADLVEQKDLTNAIALNSVATELTVIIGPALGGMLIPLLGMSGAYGLIVAVYVLDLCVLSTLKSIVLQRSSMRESAVKSLIDGFRYALNNHAVLVLLLIAFLLNLFVAPYRYSFLPLLARYVLDANATGYGLLTSMAGCGAFVAGIGVAGKGNFSRRGRLLVLASLSWPLTLLLLAMTRSYYLSLALVFLAGLAQAITWTMIATLMLSHTATPMRGRVMGLRTGVVISLPFGNFLAGAAAEQFGVSSALAIYSLCAFGLMILIIVLAPKLHALQ